MSPVAPATHLSSQTPRSLLGYFVAGSLLLHALLVVLWQGKTPAGPSARSTFQVTLLARRGDTASEPHSTEQAVPAHKSAPLTSAATSVSVTAPATAERPETPSAPVETTRITRLHAIAGSPGDTSMIRAVRAETEAHRTEEQETPSQSQQKQAGTRNGSTSRGQHELSSDARHRKTRRALLEALLPHFDYPPLARRRGWQGRVNVGLHVSADGDLTRIRLVESSGYALLDRAAVRNISELRGIPLAAQWLEGNGMDMILPVRYRLADR